MSQHTVRGTTTTYQILLWRCVHIPQYLSLFLLKDNPIVPVLHMRKLRLQNCECPGQ